MEQCCQPIKKLDKATIKLKPDEKLVLCRARKIPLAQVKIEYAETWHYREKRLTRKPQPKVAGLQSL